MPAVRISDHALVRYLERVYEIDMNAVRAEMRADLGPVLPYKRFTANRDGLLYQVRDNTIVTVHLAGDAKRCA